MRLTCFILVKVNSLGKEESGITGPMVAVFHNNLLCHL